MGITITRIIGTTCMAKRGKRSGFKLKMPTVRDITLDMTTTDGTGKSVVQTNLLLGRMNGRLYRQCYNYDVSFTVNQMITSTADPERYNFYTLPNNRFVIGAIRYAYQTYWASMQEELGAGIKPAKYHDFSINEQNPDDTWDYMGAMLFDGDGYSTISGGEVITDSAVTDSGGTAQGFHLIGNLNNSFNIFREYAQFLNYHDTDGTVSSSQPYDGLLDLKDADMLTERGDSPPWDRDWGDWLPDDTTVDDAQGHTILNLQDSLISRASTGMLSRSTTRTFTAPLGLVWIYHTTNNSAADLADTELILRVPAGKYKGVKATSIVM